MEQAGSNKNELLKVIDHYKQDAADSLKLKAAYFLIENMPGHFSYDTTYLYKYRPVIKAIHSLRLKGLSRAGIKERVDPVMDSLISRYPLSYIYSINKSDIKSIKSAYLIHTIDQAFEAYHKNPFKGQIPFDDFLDYILPYRIENGYAIEEWRPYITANYSLRRAQHFTNMEQLRDSLLINFHNVKIGWKVADRFPYLRLSDYLKSQTTHCPQKCWFNCMLLRSFGIPVTVDFVPVSRVHTLGHEWNSIKLKSGIYPFEPFWIDSLRNLKAFYTRKKIHPEIGPFQFPKIYRKTYRINSNELLKHTAGTGEEIPPFFRNPFFKDVTHEYFKTFDLESPLVKKIKKLDYAYACVLGEGQTWIPVDFGRIENDKILFHSLGSENVYLPVYYQLNSFVPAAYPVLLNKDGSRTILNPDTLHTRKIIVSQVAFQRPEEKEYKQAFIGATIEGSNNKNFEQSDILYSFNKAYEPGTYRIPLRSNKKYRYVRFSLPNKKIKLNEISFFSKLNGIEEEVRGELMTSNPIDSPRFRKVVDGDLVTGGVFTSLNQNFKLTDRIWIGYDLKEPMALHAFEFYFVLNSNLRKEGIYELLYWDFGWRSLGQQRSNSLKPISFDHVPKNALLMIRIRDTGNYSRVFTYSERKQNWL